MTVYEKGLLLGLAAAVLAAAVRLAAVVVAGYAAWLHRKSLDVDIRVPGLLTIKRTPPGENG